MKKIKPFVFDSTPGNVIPFIKGPKILKIKNEVETNIASENNKELLETLLKDVFFAEMKNYEKIKIKN